MKQTIRKTVPAVLLALLLLFLVHGSAAADPGAWVLPWSELDHGYLSSVLIDNSNAADIIGTSDIGIDGVKYTGYWHSMFFRPSSMLRNKITLIAPAAGTVMYSTKWNLEVMTDDGDLYELAIYDSESGMTEFSTGTYIRAGDTVGTLSLLTQSPALGFEYLIGRETDYLFGISVGWFTDGTDLKNRNCFLYSGPVLPDLAADAITVDGLLSPNLSGLNAAEVWEPNSWLLFDTGITNMTSKGTEGTFNVKWLINGTEVGYGAHEPVPGYTDMTEGNSALWWSFTPGEYYVQFLVDCDNYVQESDDTNNASGIYIYVGY